ncbi:alpha/beta hydrolase [Polycyclovorans algicola]|uniref:alpha/beta hydrolase n=1 Tax=Polycyclovorans algicola TaxID=616992 RepID=UPI0009FF462E|nr:alpha/beta hydrolase [Polycyclovorans algicola]
MNRMRRNLAFALTLMLLGGLAHATEPMVIDLWPAQVAENGPVNGPEAVGREGSGTGAVRNVSHARLEVYQPARPNGTAVVIAGGGGYFRIQVGRGSEPVAKWLASMGVTAAVMVYRLPGDGWAPEAPIQDGQRAIRLLRERATELAIDPKQIGILGMSAGGHLAAMTATRHAHDFYEPLDAADRQSARPDFAVLLYPVVSMRPPLDTTRTRQHMDRAPDVERMFSAELWVDDSTPPMFLVHALDDPIAHPDHSRVMFEALQARSIPSDLLLLETGGHSWGLGRAGTEPAAWPLRFSRWAREHGFMRRLRTAP